MNRRREHVLAGGGSGAIVAVALCPLDVIKTVMQVRTAHVTYDFSRQGFATVGVTDTARFIYSQAGIRGLYRGLGITLCALVPNWAVYFTVYNELQFRLENIGMQKGPLLHLASAIGAGAIADVAVNPLWMIKTRLQTQAVTPGHLNTRRYRNSVDAARTIVRDEGARALWKGMVPQLFGLLHVAVQFPLYEHLKAHLGEKTRAEGREGLSTWELVGVSSLSKIVASLVAYPHEVLRARFQYQSDSNPRRYKSLREAIVRITREEGFRGFYRGLTANLMRVVPGAAITFTSYEKLLLFLRDDLPT